ncbi:MAG: DUF2846 domain-containing protein [Polaromonas sp.]|nr:DUF2846 domain-containing protein [Polaromonas sp.]
MHIRVIACVLGIFLLAGCAAPRPVPAPTEEQASITVYRPDGFVNGGAYPYLYVDDDKIGSLMNAGHIVFGVSPGSHELVLKNIMWWSGKQGWTIDVQKGQRRYYRVLSSLNSTSVTGPLLTISKTIRIQEVPEAEALRELAKTTRSN